MSNIQIDGYNIHTKEELHQVLRNQLELDENYGGNLDALWDVLTGAVSMPLTVQWLGFEKSKEILGDYADKVIELLRDVEAEIQGFTLELYY
ncbi:barstar family protein [Paenibacillus amylolyticus]|nr:barstar family protein [Paenibacillus amylolyticus]WFR61256.1 barstar family protein [Paenibacillus amylolyticus]